MSMTQLVIGAALGFILAEGVLYGTRHALIWLRRDDTRRRLRLRLFIDSRDSAFIAAFTKYGALVGASAAVITLGAWAVGDYMAARSARSAALANTFEAATAPPAAAPQRVADDGAASAPAPGTEAPVAVAAAAADPYADPDFKVQRHTHRAGAALSLKETLVQREETKARADLLKETRQHVRRSQYDCEAADRANKYVKAGLDVWGFANWQVKYFPVQGYKGATLAECKDIKDVVDPSWLDLQSTVAQVAHH